MSDGWINIGTWLDQTKWNDEPDQWQTKLLPTRRRLMSILHLWDDWSVDRLIIDFDQFVRFICSRFEKNTKMKDGSITRHRPSPFPRRRTSSRKNWSSICSFRTWNIHRGAPKCSAVLHHFLFGLLVSGFSEFILAGLFHKICVSKQFE